MTDPKRQEFGIIGDFAGANGIIGERHIHFASGSEKMGKFNFRPFFLRVGKHGIKNCC